ncbi:MAG: DUF4364 family protein [Clostridia bacterium]|nr:DUF4364 family protein [Clostridia bacterium]
MPIQRTDAELTALFIFSSLPDEVTLSEAEEILLSCDGFDRMEIDGYISELEKRGNIYIKQANNEKYVGITELGQSVVSAFSEKKPLYRSTVNKAMRHYKKIVCGIDYRIDLMPSAGGSKVSFDMLLNGKIYFSTSLFFTKSMDALKVYNRMDNDPEGFYNGVMTVATGEIDYL